jgi:prepilin-type N-terminal cleavage/methylation domain-containing protein/prepilin-type processing-associated H-X9-DG protein
VIDLPSGLQTSGTGNLETIMNTVTNSPLTPGPSPARGEGRRRRAAPPQRRFQRGAFTLVELLVVITIIGILVALLLPAVNSAREAARSTQCKNNLLQFGVATNHHEQQKGYFPSGGWGAAWVGDPNQGFGYKQPGNWAYSLLPFMEQENVWKLGQSIPLTGGTTPRSVYIGEQVTTIISGYFCPSGRRANTYPYSTSGSVPATYDVSVSGSTSLAGKPVCKIDYAINAGDTPYNATSPLGPKYVTGTPLSTLYNTFMAAEATGTNGSASWKPLITQNSTHNSTTYMTGVSFAHSQIRSTHISDGLSNTYLVGEKYLDPNNYTTGTDYGDSTTAFTGFDCVKGESSNTFRYGGVNPLTPWTDQTTNPPTTYSQTGAPPMHEMPGTAPGTAITGETAAGFAWGSIHPTSCNFVFCDGSVHAINFSISAEVHRRLSNRADGLPIDQSQF